MAGDRGLSQRIVVKKFKQYGLSLRGDALQYLKAQLKKQESAEVQSDLVDRIIELVREQDQDLLVVSQELLAHHLHRLWEEQNFDAAESSLRFLSAFEHPKMDYNSNLNNYVTVPSSKKLHGSANSRTHVMRGRIEMLRRRLKRHPNFDHSLSAMTSNTSWELTPVESLVGSSGSKYVLGTLSYVIEGQLSIEDLSGHCKLDLSRLKSRSEGFFTEGSTVLLQGRYLGDRFVAEILGFPFSETRQTSLERFPGVNFTGIETLPASAQEQLKEYFNENPGVSFLLLADVWLDKPDVIDHLTRLFNAYDATDVMQQPPELVVMMGNFCSKPYNTTSHDIQEYRNRFTQLGNLIASYPNMAEYTTFAFVPGPHDPMDTAVLPHSPLPLSFARGLQKIPNLELCSNPCRLVYCEQEILFFRDDLLNKLSRSTVLPVQEETDAKTQLVQTVVEQGHLSPLPLSVRPVYWNFDHALHLEVLPDVMVLADRCDQYEVTCAGCLAVNPSSFGTDFSFAVFCPASKEVVFSVVQDEDPVMESLADESEEEADVEMEEGEGEVDEGVAEGEVDDIEMEDVVKHEGEGEEVVDEIEEFEEEEDGAGGQDSVVVGSEAEDDEEEEEELVDDVEDFDDIDDDVATAIAAAEEAEGADEAIADDVESAAEK